MFIEQDDLDSIFGDVDLFSTRCNCCDDCDDCHGEKETEFEVKFDGDWYGDVYDLVGAIKDKIENTAQQIPTPPPPKYTHSR